MGLICSGGACICNSVQYWDDTLLYCVDKLAYNTSCTSVSQCNNYLVLTCTYSSVNTTNTTVVSSGTGVCACSSGLICKK
jgi:hypothetical protein